MLDKIQFLLSLQILGFCVFGGITLLLRARENRAKQILGWSMLLWAFLAAVRVSVNLYLEDSKEIFHPDVLDYGMYCSSYIGLLRDRSVTTLLYDRSPFLYFYQSDMGIGYFFFDLPAIRWKCSSL